MFLRLFQTINFCFYGLLLLASSCTVEVKGLASRSLASIGPLALSSFNTGGAFRGNTSQQVSWSGDSTQLVQNSVEIDYSVNGGSSWTTLATGQSTSGNFTWMLPAIDSTQMLVQLKATELSSRTISVISSVNFAVITTAPVVTLTSLTGGSLFAGGSTQSINWTATSAYFGSSPISLFYSTDGGTTWTAIASGISNSAHPYAWVVPLVDTTNAKVKVVAIDQAGNSGSNQSSSTLSIDSTSPAVALTSLTGGQFISGVSSQAITWTASDLNLAANPITIDFSSDGGSTWTNIASSIANSGSYSWTPSAALNSATCKIRVSAVDSVGHVGQALSATNFIVDNTPPAVSGLTINSGASTATNNYVQLAFQATDTLSPISYVCFKSNTTAAPSASDSCWTAVTALGLVPAKTLNVSNAPFLIGFSPGVYSVYAYAMDAAGNMSALSGSGSGTIGTDKQNITYSPGAPPTLIDVLAAGSATPTEPNQVQADLQAPLGADVYIQWNASSASNGLTANPISITYITNGSSGAVASSLINGANGCSPDASHTGCYKWVGGSPTSSYFAVRVSATDTVGLKTSETSSGLNTWPPINFLAGNTDTGVGSSATSAVFSGNTSQTYITDAGSLAVAENGTVYFRDIHQGIMMVSPSNGVQTLLLPLNSSNSSSFGDGGPVSSATVKSPYRITLDFSGNLLIWDYDRIRKVVTSTNPMTISTLIGGGSSLADGVTPSQVQISPATSYTDYVSSSPLFALPNGDIYFQSEDPVDVPATSANGTGYRIRVYHFSSGLVQSIYVTGQGDSCASNENFSGYTFRSFGVTFDPISSAISYAMNLDYNYTVGNSCSTGLNVLTGAVTPNPITGAFPPFPGGGTNIGYNATPQYVVGHDGKLYAVWVSGQIYRYNYATNNWTLLVGNGSKGYCNDGTLASSCAAIPNDVYVTASGQIYYIDRGKIRTLDNNGDIVSLMGQRLNYGDGGNPLSARFNQVESIDVFNNGGGETIDAMDENEVILREFKIGGTISTIAGTGGNGTGPYATGVPATSVPILTNNSAYFSDFKVNSTTGDVFFSSNGYVEKLDRGTGEWETLVGAGGTLYSSADGDLGSSITLSGNETPTPRILGWDGSNVLAVPEDFSSSLNDYVNTEYKLYDSVTGLQTGLGGLDNTSVGEDGLFCGGTIPANSCALPYNIYSVQIGATHDSYASPTRWIVGLQGDNIVRAFDETFVSHSNTGNKYDLATTAVSFLSVAYRHDASNNVIYYCGTDGVLHKHDMTSGADTPYAWPVTAMTCTGRALIYDSTRDSLIFPYIQNGLYGIAEYTAP